MISGINLEIVFKWRVDCHYCDAQAPPHPSQVTELPGVATHEER